MAEQPPANKVKILGLIPREHRLPAVLFGTIEVVLGGIAYGSNSNVKMVAIVGMVVIACVFLLRFFPKNSDSRTKNMFETQSRACISPWIASINKAEKRVQMLGINFMGSLHDTREHLIQILKNGADIQILLLDWKSEAFQNREMLEGKHKTNGKISRRLNAESKAAFEIIRDINLFSDGGNIKLRVFNEPPTRSILIVDNKRVLYNSYSTVRDKKADSADVDLSRGNLGGIESYSVGDGLFEQKTDEFTDLWDKAAISGEMNILLQ